MIIHFHVNRAPVVGKTHHFQSSRAYLQSYQSFFVCCYRSTQSTRWKGTLQFFQTFCSGLNWDRFQTKKTWFVKIPFESSWKHAVKNIWTVIAIILWFQFCLAVNENHKKILKPDLLFSSSLSEPIEMNLQLLWESLRKSN